MNIILIGSVVLLVVILLIALVVFRPGKDFNPEREREQAMPLNQDSPVMMRYPGGPQEGDEPVQDVLSYPGGSANNGKLPAAAKPMPQDMLQQIGPSGAPGMKPSAVPLPKAGPIIRSLDGAQAGPAQDTPRPGDPGANA